jgi:hypothetical protein
MLIYSRVDDSYTIFKPLLIRRLFFLACVSIFADASSSLSAVESRFDEATTLTLASIKLVSMPFNASVVLCIVSDALFAVLIMISTDVLASEWNLALPIRTSPVATLQNQEPCIYIT